MSNITTTVLETQTRTFGTTAIFSASATNDLRFNYSRSRGANDNIVDNFGGATVPSLSALSPTFPVDANSYVTINLGFPLAYSVGFESDNLQRQINIVDNLSIVAG